MQRKRACVRVFLPFLFLVLMPGFSHARVDQRVNARSAVLIDMDNGNVLFEQNADYPIPPASITKILSLYLIFEAIKEGEVHLTDMVEISARAASTGGSRMGLKARTRVPLEELIKGMAVVSGNDACVAAAEHISGSVDLFVKKMNAKARELGMTNSRFMTPNGLPAAGQVTTAHDIAKLSTAYLHRFPESLAIHSMQSFSYGRSTHHNANRLLGVVPGVDGLKTGFVCASGYNISATGKRSGVRMLAVVMGARTAGIRCAEAAKLLETGFRECGSPHADIKCAANSETVEPATVKNAEGAVSHGKRMRKNGKPVRVSSEASKTPVSRKLSARGKRGEGHNKLAAHKARETERVASRNARTKSSRAEKSTAKSNVKAGRHKNAVSSKSTKEEAKTARKKNPGAKPTPQAQASRKKDKG